MAMVNRDPDRFRKEADEARQQAERESDQLSR
jgi:hypothetical protein